ncbi:hypothetical protein AAG906_015246 [Vitis piasezkii]
MIENFLVHSCLTFQSSKETEEIWNFGILSYGLSNRILSYNVSLGMHREGWVIWRQLKEVLLMQALALAPIVDRGLSWFTKFKFESRGKRKLSHT